MIMPEFGFAVSRDAREENRILRDHVRISGPIASLFGSGIVRVKKKRSGSPETRLSASA